MSVLNFQLDGGETDKISYPIGLAQLLMLVTIELKPKNN